MTSDNRITPGLIYDVADALERHGYYRSDDQHADRAIGLLGDLARIYEGTQDHPYGPTINQTPSPPPPEPPGPEPGPNIPEDDLHAVTLTHAEVRTILTSLDLAAEWKRDHAETCTYCPDQSCYACQLRLHNARTYDQLAVQLLHDEQATRDQCHQPGPATSPTPPMQPHPAAEMEAGQ